MDIYEVYRWIMDLIQRYEDGDTTDEENYFLNDPYKKAIATLYEEGYPVADKFEELMLFDC